MKICFLTNNLNLKNGGGRFSYELIEHLRKNTDDSIKVLTTVKSGHDLEEGILSTSKIKLLLSIFKIRQIFKQCDVIHALDCFPYGIISVLAGLGLNKKIVITAIGSSSIKPLYSKWKWLLYWAYKKADLVTAISHYTAREIKKKVDNLDIEVIVPGINYKHFAKLSQGIQKDANKNFILSVGRIKERKGQEYSIRAFAKVAGKFPSLKYVIVGSSRGVYFEKIKKLTQDLNIEDRVTFKKDISDEQLVKLYIDSKLFILLSQNVGFDVEGFGLVFVEAAAFGIPSIGSKNCGAEDAILDKQNGFLIDPRNIDEAAKKIEYILSDENLQNNFRIKSIKFAKGLDWSIILKKYLKIYELLFKGSV